MSSNNVKSQQNPSKLDESDMRLARNVMILIFFFFIVNWFLHSIVTEIISPGDDE